MSSIQTSSDRDSLKQLMVFHTAMIHSFNDERIVHLVVTMIVGLGLLMTSISTLAYQLNMLIPIDVLLTVLFIPYIYHYYRLENSIQDLYPLTEEIQKKMS
jgi:hypothetical protein